MNDNQKPWATARPAAKGKTVTRSGNAKAPSGTVPLVRALSKLGLASRTQTQGWIEAGRLAVNGKVVKDPQLPVVPERDRFALDGKSLQQQQRICIVLHKPRGYVTTRSDDKGRKTVFDLLPPELHNLHAVGRLDLHTSGLLLLTNDTKLSSFLTDPANAIAREYAVSVDGKVSDETLRKLAAGIEDDGELLQASKVSVRKLSGRESHLFVTLHEGKNREIRRLFKALGHEVNKLKRLAFGPVALGELESGKYQVLTDAELTALHDRRSGS
ncbi:MAG TPA: pseudouridine synthase [Candidatus Acidoferrum sp.]|nr:pseudouridine synthase [Candidatus Acidoferrum sp.]